MTTQPPEITIRCGLEFTYEAAGPTPIMLVIEPQTNALQRIDRQLLNISPWVFTQSALDWAGNVVRRFNLPQGRTTVRYDSLVATRPVSEDHLLVGYPTLVTDLSLDLVRYTLPSRYCDSDRLMSFAFEKFGQVPNGLLRVQAICNWVHSNIEYRWGSGNPTTSASEVIRQGHGVCRDFAHTAIALSRCFNIPTRYVTGYVPDVGVWDPGSPMDFHAYMEVYVGNRWHTFDARFNEPRIGRVKIASGLDAVDGAFSTLFGAANLSWFQVWAYQVDPLQVNLGDPIDLTKRLDGTPTLRFPTWQY
jgi:transglutaminase-like putative cysteine protease